MASLIYETISEYLFMALCKNETITRNQSMVLFLNETITWYLFMALCKNETIIRFLSMTLCFIELYYGFWSGCLKPLVLVIVPL